MQKSEPVKVGDKAPNFTLKNQAGDPVNLSDWLGKKPIVLYFYPKDETPGCTAEACAFRDSYEVFQEAGAEVVGVSADSASSHQQFAARHNLPFTLLSDQDNQVRKRYGVPATLFILPGRVTYVIDREGIVQHIFDSQLDFQAHVRESLETLRRLQTA
ncbi:MAG: peroxiredoxin [Leptolyngbyaceae cyanobacterium MO_188.B28]|nr:peroxiredoxin [Leptolyngbyaceae cyanobacterium MO_188.B28]